MPVDDESTGPPLGITERRSPGRPTQPDRRNRARAALETARASDAEGGNRTPTPSRAPDFESGASTSSATSAGRDRSRVIRRVAKARGRLLCHARRRADVLRAELGERERAMRPRRDEEVLAARRA